MATDAAQTTRTILELLRIRHAPMEWASFAELSTRTGGLYRSIDFFTMNVWPSNNFHTIAYEIKASRADFNRELANPKKRAEAESLCNECYFAMPAGIASVDEIPENWGFLQLTKGGLRKKKHALQRQTDGLPIIFVASLLRRAADPESRFPAAVWLRAGQDIGEDIIAELAKAEAERQIYDARAEAREGVRNSEDYQRLREFRGVVMSKLGYEYGDPEKFAEWLANIVEERPELALTYQKLKSLRHSLDRILPPEEKTL